MADTVKISGLPSATTTTGADYIPIVQGGVTKKAPLNVLGTGAGIDAVSDSGLVAHWSMDNIPEIPDAPSPDTTYLQDAWATVDGWIENGLTIAVSDGSLLVSKPSSGDGIYRGVSEPHGKTCRIKIKNASALTGLEYYNGVSRNSFTLISDSGDEKIYSTLISTTEPANLYLYFSMPTGTSVLVNWVYIGTGAYLPNSLLDNSGNGNHGTIFGATPVTGISGKALAFDSGNYVETGKYLSGSDRTYSFWVNRAISDNSNIILTNKSVIRILTSSIQYYADYDATPDISVSHGILTSTWAHFVITHTGTIAKCYKDGTLIATNTSSVPINNTNSSTFGLCKGLGFPGYIGTIDEPRIYNRALSAEEVYSLYMSKGRGPDAQVKSVRGVANSLVVRNASGQLQDMADYGIGTYSALCENNFDTINKTGFYSGYNATGAPSSGYWQVEHIQYIDTQYATQIAHNVAAAGPITKERRKDNGTWSAWYEVWNSYTDGNGGQPPAAKVNGDGTAKNSLGIGMRVIEDFTSGQTPVRPSCGGTIRMEVLTYGSSVSSLTDWTGGGDGGNWGAISGNGRIRWTRIA